MQYRKFEGPAIAMGEIKWWKLRPKKSKTSVRFLWPLFLLYRPPSPIAIIVGPWMSDKNRSRKNWNHVGLIFWPWFSSPNHPLAPLHNCNHCRILEFMILRLRQTFLRIWTLEFAIAMGVGGGGNENRGWKNRKCRQGVEKMFKVWTRQVAHPSSQTSSHTA